MSRSGYALRVYVKGREPADAPLTDENGRAFAEIFARMEQDPMVAALFEQVLAAKWPEIAQQMFEAGTLPYAPTLEEVAPEFELIVPDEELNPNPDPA